MPAPKGTRPPNAGKGRPKGAANKMNRSLRDMILGALDDAGGQAYLAEQAHQNPAAFLTLLGRVLPREPIETPPAVITLDFGYRTPRAPAQAPTPLYHAALAKMIPDTTPVSVGETTTDKSLVISK
jgi:hypothetical protein